MNKINFCKNLRGIRKLKKKSQKQLARYAGLSQSYISSLELGISSPTLKVIEKLSRGLNVSVAELLF
ncbi:helix-turn-helix transcriptional regulator [Clostridium botulinum]|nr:helix-turn-helix transcriptional regulator [Clostridium botulinum]